MFLSGSEGGSWKRGFDGGDSECEKQEVGVAAPTHTHAPTDR